MVDPVTPINEFFFLLSWGIPASIELRTTNIPVIDALTPRVVILWLILVGNRLVQRTSEQKKNAHKRDRNRFHLCPPYVI
jgi:hypothetical protein